MVKIKYIAAFLMGMSAFSFLTCTRALAQSGTVIWKINSLSQVGKYAPEVLGKPQLSNNGHSAVSFNGVNDGLIVPANPIEGWSKFTIEFLFKPDGDGPVEPRFVHFQDGDMDRGTLEIRLTPQKRWYLDAFLKNGKTNDRGLALNDTSLLHGADKWYWVAMVYDGKTLSSYVNGVKELEGPVNFPVMKSGQISIGVRLNKVSWFKGAISEARFHPEALAASALQKEQ